MHLNLVKSVQHLKPPNVEEYCATRESLDSQAASPTLFALSQGHGSRSPAP
jgi:hypothetical protein